MNLLYHTFFIINPPSLSFAQMRRVIPEILSIWGIGYCIPPQKFSALRQCCCRCAEPATSKLLLEEPQRWSHKEEHIAELNYHGLTSVQNAKQKMVLKKKANAPEKSPEQRHPLVSLSYFQNFEFLSLLNPTFQKKLHTCFFFWDLSVHEEKE